MTKTKRIIFSIVALAEIFLLNVGLAKALSIPTANEIAADLEQRYHVSSSSIQNMGENLNVAADKSTAPQVMIFFEPSDPQEGKKITARALPMYFQNPKEKLYYTWYIKHGPTNSDSNWNKNEDLNGDGRKNVEDGKIEAMRLIATNGYSNQDEPRPDYGKNGDNDEYQSCIGGDDKCGTGTSYCYIHDFQRGTNSEIVDSDGDSECEHLFPDTDGHGTAGDENFGHDEEKFWGTNPQDANTAGNGNLDEASVSGLGQDEFSWIYQKGDNVGVAVEGTSLIPTKYPGGSFMTMWALTDNTCKGSDPWTEQQAICPTVQGGSVEDSTLTPLCGKTVDNYFVSGGDAVSDFSCNNTKTTPSCNGSSAVCDSGQRAMCVPNSENSLDDQTVLSYFKGSCLLSGGLCVASGGLGVCNNALTADGKCEYLYTTSDSCSAKDPVCVSVEHSSGADEPAPLLQTGNKSATVSGFSVTIPTTTIDLNDCLKYNLVDPAEKKLEKLDVSLDYTPENPTNDASDSQMGDVLTASSIINNPSQNSRELRYEWKIEAKRKGSFIDLSKNLIEDKLIEKLEGLGLSFISLKLNLGVKYKDYFDNDFGSLKITNTVKDSSSGKIRVGKGEIIVNINSTSKRINAYSTGSGDGVTLNKGDLICGKDTTEKLEDKTAFYVCPVTRNQILKLEIDSSGMSDFYWTVDGKSVGCNDPVSENCASANSMVMPVTDSEGKIFSVKVAAKNIKEGKSVELSKTFQIVKPYIKISPKTPETFWPKVLGNYSDLNGVKYPDLSNSVFETQVGSKVTLNAEFHPLSLNKIVENSSNVNIEWKIDGIDAGNSKSVDFNVGKEAGGFYTIELNAVYGVPNEIRKILKDKWNISQTDSEGEVLSASIQAEVMPEGIGGTVASKNTGRILASLISNLPSQITFLLRISLTVFVIIMISGIASNSSYFLNRSR
ncbi:MAG: hypothetical protein Q7S18_03655 [bacterium]|nr:hypothetical protein [bacterium]